MPIKRFIVSPPKEMTKESVRIVAERIFEALKGKDAPRKAVVPPTGPDSSPEAKPTAEQPDEEESEK